MTIRAVVILAFFGLILSSASVRAEDSGACMQDAFSICGQFIPDRERVAACLISHRSKVSAACRSALSHFSRRTASVD
jgi:hypothetical protein